MREKQDLAVCETDDFTPRAPPRSRPALGPSSSSSSDTTTDAAATAAAAVSSHLRDRPRLAPPICETDEHALESPTHRSKASRTGSGSGSIDKGTLDYVLRSGLAGGMAGCVAKTVIAPLDRVKILFQTSNPAFAQYSGQWMGVWHAARDIRRESGVAGLFRGHAATLLRIFPYAAIKFVAYEQFRAALIPREADEVPWRRFAAGSLAGMTTVFFTYPLEVVRVRLAFETRQRKVSIRGICREMFYERTTVVAPSSSSPSSSSAQMSSSSGRTGGGSLAGRNALHGPAVVTKGLANFYRGFSPTIAGMLPYAGVSFLTYDWFTDILSTSPRLTPYTMARDAPVDAPSATHDNDRDHVRRRPPLLAWAKLTAGGAAGLLSQTASYPLEVVRRRMQVSGAVGTGQSLGFWECAAEILQTRGVRGFYVGLTIGYIKVVPMVACSFYVYERMKSLLEI